jgi:hypothetical protein
MININLDKYFYTTKKYYNFFDAISKEKDELKSDIMKELKIVYSTYRTNKRKENSPRDYIDLLLAYTKYSDVDLVNKNNYEVLLTKIYYTIYYRQLKDLSSLSEELNKYIEENNYLKPVFVLFKMFCVINEIALVYDIIKRYKQEFDYLYLFRKENYFEGNLRLIFLLVLFHADYAVDRNEIENLVYENTELSWLYNNVMAAHYYKSGNDIKAYMYYNETIKNYEIDDNIERKMFTISNISYLLNLEDMYVASIDKTEKVINYIYSQKNEVWMEYITQHYLFSLLMLKRYDQIIMFFEILVLDYEKLNIVSSIFV